MLSVTQFLHMCIHYLTFLLYNYNFLVYQVQYYYMSATINSSTYLSTHVARGTSSHIHFDNNAVKIILDTWCSFTISYDYKGFINLEPSTGQVKGLGVHKIKGRGTFKYTIVDNTGTQVNIIIEDALYVSTLDTRLLFLQ